jgi:hypothetical protein
MASCQRAPGQQASSPTGGSDASASSPFDLDAMMAREAGELTAKAVTSPDSKWVTQAYGVADAKVFVASEIVIVEIPIGTKAPIRCQVFDESVDPGGTLNSVLAESAKVVDYQRVAPAGVAVIGGAPAMFVRTLYVADGANGKLAGALKLAFHAREGAPALCLHDEVGYQATFERVSKGFFEGFKLANDATAKPKYLEIAKTQLDERDVGFSLTKILAGEKPGWREYVSQRTTLIPTSPKDLAVQDSYNTLQVDTKGRLQRGVWVSAESGELTLQVTVTRSAAGKYAYEGTVSGRPVQGELSASSSISTPLQSMELLKRKLKAKKPFSEKLFEYHPSIDPSSAIPVVYSHESGAEPDAVTVELGQKKLLTRLDEHGTPASATLQLGPRSLRIVREFREGTL